MNRRSAKRNYKLLAFALLVLLLGWLGTPAAAPADGGDTGCWESVADPDGAYNRRSTDAGGMDPCRVCYGYMPSSPPLYYYCCGSPCFLV